MPWIAEKLRESDAAIAGLQRKSRSWGCRGRERNSRDDDAAEENYKGKKTVDTGMTAQSSPSTADGTYARGERFLIKPEASAGTKGSRKTERKGAKSVATAGRAAHI